MIRIALESPAQADVVRLIDELDAYQEPLYPAESHHGIDLDALCAPDVLFAVARDALGSAVACGALVLKAGYGEIKRMYTLPTQRGQGLGRSLLTLLETEAHARGCARIALETGYLQDEALRFYERHGYRRCAPFGDYLEDPHSVFMEKHFDRVDPAMAREVSVWRATLVDVDVVAPLFDAYRQFYGRRPDLRLAHAFLRERVLRGESVLLIARDGVGGLRGFTQLYPLFSSVRAARGYLLNDLYVAESARRNGVARLLLQAAADFARAEGVARLKLFTALTNSPAQGLYESLGWVRDTDYYEYNLDL